MGVYICGYDMCVKVEVIYRSQLSNVMVAWLVVWLFCFVFATITKTRVIENFS